MGKFNCYRRHIHNFAEILKPLSNLIKGLDNTDNLNEKVEITDDAKKAIDTMKQKLINPTILAFADWKPNENFRLHTDTSNFAISCLITQVQSGTERVIPYGSRKNNQAQQKYCINRLEMLALLFAVEAHRFLLYPRHFLWITDNKSLKCIASMSPLKGMTQRWLTLLGNFNFDIDHRSNKK